jgi:hypothetical protein
MKEFIYNGFILVEGNIFNWRKQSKYIDQPDPYFLTLGFGDSFESFDVAYDINKNELIISNLHFVDEGFVIKFNCNTIDEAENIANSFRIGMGFDIPKLNKK